jgi:hypothetical protein
MPEDTNPPPQVVNPQATQVSLDLEAFKRDLAHSFDQSLKAELAQMELRLVRSLTESLAHKADQTVVAEMDKRVQGLETSRAERQGMANEILDMNKRLTALEKFRYAVPSVAFISMVLSMILVYYYTLH